MFKNPFSFSGRIRRTEYGISFIIYLIVYVFLESATHGLRGNPIFFLLLIPIAWFLWAQGAKRCHDLGNSGWWQLFPLYIFLMLFLPGNMGFNEYGENPKRKIDFGSDSYVRPAPSDTNSSPDLTQEDDNHPAP